MFTIYRMRRSHPLYASASLATSGSLIKVLQLGDIEPFFFEDTEGMTAWLGDMQELKGEVERVDDILDNVSGEDERQDEVGRMNRWEMAASYQSEVEDFLQKAATIISKYQLKETFQDTTSVYGVRVLANDVARLVEIKRKQANAGLVKLSDKGRLSVNEWRGEIEREVDLAPIEGCNAFKVTMPGDKTVVFSTLRDVVKWSKVTQVFMSRIRFIDEGVDEAEIADKEDGWDEEKRFAYAVRHKVLVRRLLNDFHLEEEEMSFIPAVVKKMINRKKIEDDYPMVEVLEFGALPITDWKKNIWNFSTNKIEWLAGKKHKMEE